MTEQEIKANYREFEETIEDTGRKGAENLMSWLRGTTFFRDPSSAAYHLAEPGGLCRHSLNVYHRAMEEFQSHPEDYPGVTWDQVAIAALLHDLCKIGTYEVYTRNVKGEDGKWTQVQAYRKNDPLPMGHGEKSLWLVTQYMPLSTEEAMAIRWHMGAFDEAVKGGFRDLSKVYSAYPLAYLIHQADEKATYFDEKN